MYTTKELPWVPQVFTRALGAKYSRASARDQRMAETTSGSETARGKISKKTCSRRYTLTYSFFQVGKFVSVEDGVVCQVCIV